MIRILFITQWLVLASFSSHCSADTLDHIIARGTVRCGITKVFDNEQTNPQLRSSIAADLCRGISAALFQTPDKVEFLDTTLANRFKFLDNNKVDILIAHTSITQSRELQYLHSTPYFFDQQSILVPKRSSINSLKQLNGAVICIKNNTTHRANLKNIAANEGIAYQSIYYNTNDDGLKLLQNGSCDALSADHVILCDIIANHTNSLNYRILPEDLSLEVISPMMRLDDSRLQKLTNWVIYALIRAEELGLTQATVRQSYSSPHPQIKQFISRSETAPYSYVGLQRNWSFNLIKSIGNYREIYERNMASHAQCPRKLNSLWKDGGLLYAPFFG